MGEMHEKPGHIKLLEQWMKSYKPEELFDAKGRFKPETGRSSRPRDPVA
jgi:xylulose-5-phosphate/fructose-6-phosphate phosphoketolase